MPAVKRLWHRVLLLVVSDDTGKEVAIGNGFRVSSDRKLITNRA